MKSPLKLGLADYFLIALTCLLVLLFVERWKPDVDAWLKDLTREDPPAPEHAPVPDAVRDWLERRQDTAPGTGAPTNPGLSSDRKATP